MTVFDSGCPTKRQSKSAVAAKGRSSDSRDSFLWKNIWETRVPHGNGRVSVSPHGVTLSGGATYAQADDAAPTGGGIHRNILVGFRRLRQRSVRREVHVRRHI